MDNTYTHISQKTRQRTQITSSYHALLLINTELKIIWKAEDYYIFLHGNSLTKQDLLRASTLLNKDYYLVCQSDRLILKAKALLPKGCAENSVGRLYLLPLRSHSTEITLVQWSIEASL